MPRRLLPLIAAFLALAASAAQARPDAQPQRAETVYGARFDERGLTLRVPSNGCTRKEHFSLRVSPGRETRVLAVRTRPDLCKALVRGGVEVTWSHAELGIRRGALVRIMNRFQVW